MPSLLVIDGPNAETLVPLGTGVTVLGREESLKVQLKDPKASRRHFRVSHDEDTGEHVVEDLESRHGTLLNGRRLLLSTPLKDGDRITAGESVLVYLAEQHPDATSALAAVKALGERDIKTL